MNDRAPGSRSADRPAHDRQRRTAPRSRCAASRSRPKNGTGPVLSRSPRIASVAGRNVRLPMTATKTTAIVPIAIDRKSETSSRNSPAIEIITASPEKNTARPAVLLAISIGEQLGRGRRAARCGSA